MPGLMWLGRTMSTEAAAKRSLAFVERHQNRTDVSAVAVRGATGLRVDNRTEVEAVGGRSEGAVAVRGAVGLSVGTKSVVGVVGNSGTVVVSVNNGTDEGPRGVMDAIGVSIASRAEVGAVEVLEVAATAMSVKGRINVGELGVRGATRVGGRSGVGKERVRGAIGLVAALATDTV